mgnify:CR=1 FL=1
MTQETATLRVQRGGPDDEPTFDEFAVPHREGMSVLDALIWVRANTDSSLAIRYSCTRYSSSQYYSTQPEIVAENLATKSSIKKWSEISWILARK